MPDARQETRGSSVIFSAIPFKGSKEAVQEKHTMQRAFRQGWGNEETVKIPANRTLIVFLANNLARILSRCYNF